jgi:hypothetical protein
MGGRVSAYRLYRLNGIGRIDSAEWIEALADEEAIRKARERLPSGGFELWQGRRLVCSEPTAGA